MSDEKINILIVDDLFDNLLLLESMLESDELNIITATSGFEAIEKVKQHSLALILLDVQMPEMDGFQTAVHIRKLERGGNVPIIFVTAISKERQYVFKGYHSGAVDYLFKPVAQEILSSKVRVFVNLYKQKREIEQNRNELAQFNRLLSEKNRKIEEQNDLLKEKQDSLEHVLQMLEEKSNELSIKNKDFTDSVKYARRIQQSIFPTQNVLRNIVHESFFFLKPKDILSGDFYWLEQFPQIAYQSKQLPERIFIGAFDCTGHGVPGALLSLLGYNLLNNIIKEHGVLSPAKILEYLNYELVTLLNQSANTIIKDGMEAGIISIDPENKQIEYAGAGIDLYAVEGKGENISLSITKSDKYAIGCDEKCLRNNFVTSEITTENFRNIERCNGICMSTRFANHVIKWNSDTSFYMFSDGYVDQFGGKKDKKFKYPRFRKLLQSIQNLSMHQQKERLAQTLQEWKGGREQVDDILVVGIRI